jgi:phosphate transport system permease protein
MIFNLYASPVPLVRQRAYAAAFILLVIILLISILSRWLTKRSMKFIIR